MIKNYEEKYKYLCEHQKRVIIRALKSRPALAAIIAKTRGICPIAFQKKQLIKEPDQLHHARVHDTKVNKKKYPLFIDSILNLMAVSTWQIWYGSYGKWTELQCERAERFLKRHQRIAEFVNMEDRKCR